MKSASDRAPVSDMGQHSDVHGWAMMCLSAFHCLQAAEAPRVDIAEAQPLENYPRAVQEHICASP